MLTTATIPPTRTGTRTRPPSRTATTNKTRRGVALELGDARRRLPDRFAAVSTAEWERTGTRSDGGRFTVDTFRATSSTTRCTISMMSTKGSRPSADDHRKAGQPVRSARPPDPACRSRAAPRTAPARSARARAARRRKIRRGPRRTRRDRPRRRELSGGRWKPVGQRPVRLRAGPRSQRSRAALFFEWRIPVDQAVEHVDLVRELVEHDVVAIFRVRGVLGGIPHDENRAPPVVRFAEGAICASSVVSPRGTRRAHLGRASCSDTQ